MPSEQAKEIVSQIIGTTCITSEKFATAIEVIDLALMNKCEECIEACKQIENKNGTCRECIEAIERIQGF